MTYTSGTKVISTYSEMAGEMTGNTREERDGVKVEIRWDNGKVTWVSEKVARGYVENVAWIARRS